MELSFLLVASGDDLLVITEVSRGERYGVSQKIFICCQHLWFVLFLMDSYALNRFNLLIYLLLGRSIHRLERGGSCMQSTRRHTLRLIWETLRCFLLSLWTSGGLLTVACKHMAVLCNKVHCLRVTSWTAK